jgi:hypothetical protein
MLYNGLRYVTLTLEHFLTLSFSKVEKCVGEDKVFVRWEKKRWLLEHLCAMLCWRMCVKARAGQFARY